ncbi:arsenite efflux transporter metallochaperone ArsD [Halocatena marina]|uniref:Arsenite efflux transporter metallochaperone ArsD n=1 Tax=Halocatena marina TaxID=2934937 RepID=A0ABD5YTR8_9EURY|nr:arsenite efflux transporter metallochaperone ArsD [Halocatena marina]
MTELTLYEEAMCCSTGVCGPDPDAELVEVSAALDLLEDDYDVDVSRANMQHNIDQFLETQEIADLLEAHGPSILPITVVDNEIVAKETYLSYDELASTIENSTDPQET